MNLSKHENCANRSIRGCLPRSITWQIWRKHRDRGGEERLVARVLSFVRVGHDSTRTGLFKEGLSQPRVSAKFDFRYETLRSQFSFILSAYNLIIGCSKKKRGNYPGNTFEQKKEKPGLKFNPGLALIGLRTTGSWIEGNDAIDLKLESSDSQENLKDDAQSDCSEMVAFILLPHCVS